MKRRTALRSVVLTASGLVAGCSFVDPGSSHRELDVFVDSTNSSNESTVLTVELRNNNMMGEGATFHEVTLHGFTRDGTQVCETPVGNVSYRNTSTNAKRVTLECNRFPYLLTTSARESPCSEDVDLEVLVYDDERDVWIGDRYERQCNESLPPEYPQDLPE